MYRECVDGIEHPKQIYPYQGNEGKLKSTKKQWLHLVTVYSPWILRRGIEPICTINFVIHKVGTVGTGIIELAVGKGEGMGTRYRY